MNPTTWTHHEWAGILTFGIPLIWLILFGWVATHLYRHRHYWRFRWQEWRCERARAYLDKHDAEQILENNQYELIRRRSEMRAQGIGPGDPRYPDLWDVAGEEPIIPLPHRTEKLQARGQL